MLHHIVFTINIIRLQKREQKIFCCNLLLEYLFFITNKKFTVFFSLFAVKSMVHTV